MTKIITLPMLAFLNNCVVETGSELRGYPWKNQCLKE